MYHNEPLPGPADWQPYLEAEHEQELNMHIDEMKESKYLTKHDCEPAIKVTITGLSKENLAMQGQPEELKWVLHLQEVKPMVLNSINTQLIAAVLNEKETDNWKGKQIMLYNDATVSFAGKITGGIRVRGLPGEATVMSEDPAAGVDTADVPF